MASQFSPEDVQRLATLARLELNQEEITLFASQLSEILAFAAEVQAVDTDSVAQFDQAATSATLRDDQVRPSLRREDVLAEAPAADGAGMFTVPRVFQE